MKNTIAYCKKMAEEGYANKHIELVTKLSASSVSRIVNNKTYTEISAQDVSRDSQIEDRLQVLNTLLECHEIAGGMGLDDNNKTYIKILKRIGADFAKVRELYYDISKKALRNAWMYPSGKIEEFDGSLINITAEEILDLLKKEEDK